ncbi:unnamed protein product, partial [Ectocarpus sp. 12 AP-2014]
FLQHTGRLLFCFSTRPELSATQRRAPSARGTDGSPVHGSAGPCAPHFIHCSVKGAHRAGAGCGGVDSFTGGGCAAYTVSPPALYHRLHCITACTSSPPATFSRRRL